MADYRINRERYPLDSNCAGQLRVTCTTCGHQFDVDIERASHPTFHPICFECFTPKEEVA